MKILNKNDEREYWSEWMIPAACLIFLIFHFFDASLFHAIPPETTSEWLRLIVAILILPLILIGCAGLIRYFRLWREK